MGDGSVLVGWHSITADSTFGFVWRFVLDRNVVVS